jgi:hypothetical protein
MKQSGKRRAQENRAEKRKTGDGEGGEEDTSRKRRSCIDCE